MQAPPIDTRPRSSRMQAVQRRRIVLEPAMALLGAIYGWVLAALALLAALVVGLLKLIF